MTSHFEGQREFNQRERNNKPSMDVTYATFRCAKCKQHKEAFGRKLLIKGYSKGGYKCADCVELSAAKSADKQNPPSQAGKPRVGF